MLRKILFVALLEIITLSVFAQTGSISGIVTDAANSEAVIGANVVIQGTTIGAATDIEGKFLIKNVKPGAYTLLVSFVTYKTHEVKNVIVEEGKTALVSVTLEEDAQELKEIIVTGQADKTSESVLLTERKKAVLIVQNIGAQELSRKGVSDAESAVTQITGVSKQQGVKNVFVRGLGDRYNSTSFNGLPLPSEDPAYKNISLSFFSTDIIENIDVNKSFSPNLYGDVGGANINIVSKKLFEEQEFSLSASLGANTQVLSTDFYRADGNNFLGTSNNNVPVSNLSTYSFKNSLQAKKLSTPINSGFSIKGGKSFRIGNNQLKLFLVGSMNSEYFYKEGKKAFTNTEGQYRNDYQYKKYEYNASQFGLANLSYSFGNDNVISYNTLFVHDSKQMVSRYRGFSLNGVDDITDPRAYDLYVSRQQTNNNVLVVNQLLGEFPLSNNVNLSVSGSYNKIIGNEPDRRQNFLLGNGNGEDFVANNSSPAFNHRFFSTLNENELAGQTALTYKMSDNESKIVAGYNFRRTDRNFEYTQINFAHPTGSLVNPEKLDEYFNQESINSGIIEMESSRGKLGNPKALVPFYYTGARMIQGGYVNAYYTLNPSLNLVVGARFENFGQEVVWDVAADEIRPTIAGDNTIKLNKNYLLPSFSLRYELSENDQLRFSASQSYTMPQFKEVAPFLYEDVNENIFGNTELRPSDNYNIDLKFEHYFSADELISITGFYKRVNDAINMIQVNSAALEFSYLNTGDADIFGGEVELRKRLISLPASAHINTGLNVSYLHANQTLYNDPNSKVQFLPSSKRTGLEGASPLLVNADITYTKETNSGTKITSAVVVNYFSNRIFSLGSAGQQNIIERGIPTIDFISKIDLSKRATLNVNFRNLFNPEYRQTKEVESTGKKDLIYSYKKGLTSSIGFSYRF